MIFFQLPEFPQPPVGYRNNSMKETNYYSPSGLYSAQVD